MTTAEAIKELTFGITRTSTGEEFIKSLAQSLAKALQIDYVFIGELDEQTDSIHSIAFVVKGQLVEPVQYPVVGSLCEQVLHYNFCEFPHHVQQQFPYNQSLKHYNVDSYVGIPLLSSHNKNLGILYVMHTEAIEEVDEVKTMLSLVAKRAEMELERSLYEKQLLAKNQALMQANDELAKTRQALLDTNKQLEMRVDERTRELSASEEELRLSLEQLSQTNRTLRDREAFLASIINQTSVGICVANHEGRFIFVNEGYCKITGRTQAELFTLTLLDITYIEDQGDNVEQLNNLRKTGQGFKMEKRYVRPDGSLVWCLISVSRIEQEEGLTVRTLAVCQDITERKRSEVALLQTEERFQLLSKATNDAIWDWNITASQLWWNEGYKTIFGYKAEEIEPSLEAWYNRIHPDDQKRVMEGIRQFINQGGKQRADEYRFQKGDGSYAYVLDRSYALHEQGGKVYRMIGSMMDVTERKMAEEALLRSQQQERDIRIKIEQQRQFLYLLFSQVPAIISVVRGPDLVYELANETLQKFTGKQYLGRTLREVYPEIESSLYQIYQRVYQTGERFVGQSFPIFLDWQQTGKPYAKYFNIVYEAFKDEQGKIDGVISFGYEVTSQVESRRMLEKSEAQIRLILESIPHLAWTSLPETSINYFNKRWYDYTGLSEEQSLRLGWQSVIHPDDLPIAIERRTIGRGKGEPYEVENRYRKGSDGAYRWHLARVVPIRNAEGKITLWVGTATDIHDQKTTQHTLENTLKELHEKNYELDQFVYKTSHDLRAPLTTIMGLVTILKLEPDEATKTHYVDLIETRVHKLDTFIKSMLDYSRNTRTAAKYEKINLEALLQECIAELEYMRNFDRLHVNLHIEEEYVFSDVFRLKIIFSNLISNAIKYQDYNKPQSRLNIQVMPAGNQVVITFADNGVGIDQAYQDRIFNMFFRAAEQSEGSGLGLYIVKQAATVLQGNIHLASQAGKGTTFTVTLPRLTPEFTTR
ncbi:PAS domain S-box protein [Rhodocytophaga rosea]|uniref:histidine kinase n=1 Tax=Rhodocytophaga rosea TaxID=2704465 RepID=A0A6C0GJX4_9BACT|nr:PAS domain S-box protein [Rhodocytophaga rosea]QHT68247.1 PAS domain S-box protein [Rhodocytophaga rosea]